MADTFKFVQTQPFSLAGAGAILGATTITLKSFTTIDGVLLTMSDFGDIGFGTLQPGEGTLEEQISFSDVVQNINGTATLTGVKSVAFIAPYTQTSGLAKTHAGSTSFVISNTAGFYDKFAAKNDDETITGIWDFENVPTTQQDPVSSNDLTRRSWVLSIVNGGPVSMDQLIETGTAGETVVAGNMVYLKSTDGRWWLTDADTTSTIQNVQLGIAQGSGTAGNAISGGVLRRGIDDNQSGGSVGLAYAGNVAGKITTASGTNERVIGEFISATQVVFDPFFYYLLTVNIKNALQGAGNFGTPSSTNKFITQNYNSSNSGLPIVHVYTGNDTWTKPSDLKYAVLEVVGGGGGGGGTSSSAGIGAGGGGGGGYSKKIIASASLAATEAITVGVGGVAGAATGGTGGTGGTTSIGALLQATGGVGGEEVENGGEGGMGSSGDLNAGGGSGTQGSKVPSGDAVGGNGGNSVLGGGGRGGTSNSGGLAAGAGAVYGGGGGGANADGNNTAGGVGADGVVIITEYYS